MGIAGRGRSGGACHDGGGAGELGDRGALGGGEEGEREAGQGDEGGVNAVGIEIWTGWDYCLQDPTASFYSSSSESSWSPKSTTPASSALRSKSPIIPSCTSNAF